jgi:hypothetical protein
MKEIFPLAEGEGWHAEMTNTKITKTNKTWRVFMIAPALQRFDGRFYHVEKVD